MNKEETVFFEAIEKAKKAEEGKLVGIIKEIAAIFKDGKVEPKELPTLVALVAKLIGLLGGLLGMLNVPKQILTALEQASSVLTTIAEVMAKNVGDLAKSWSGVQAILADGKVSIGEIVPLISTVLAFVNVVVEFSKPFLDDNSLKQLLLFSSKLTKIGAFINKLPFTGGPVAASKTKPML